MVVDSVMMIPQRGKFRDGDNISFFIIYFGNLVASQLCGTVPPFFFFENNGSTSVHFLCTSKCVHNVGIV